MERYIPHNHTPAMGATFLCLLTPVLAVIVGVAAFFISNLVYLFFIFPLAIGLVAGIGYQRLIHNLHVRNRALTVMMSLVLGLGIAFSFHYSNYIESVSQGSHEFQKTYNVSEVEAEESIQQYLIEETGSSGLWGYTKFRAMVGESYKHTVMIGGVVASENTFTLATWQAWAYWIIEIMLFCVIPIYIGVSNSRKVFSKRANEWYRDHGVQIADAPISDLSRILFSLDHSHLHDIANLIQSEGSLSHPKLEIYQTPTEQNSGYHLLKVISTGLVKKRTVPRKEEALWELDELQYSFIKSIIDSISTEE